MKDAKNRPAGDVTLLLYGEETFRMLIAMFGRPPRPVVPPRRLQERERRFDPARLPL